MPGPSAPRSPSLENMDSDIEPFSPDHSEYVPSSSSETLEEQLHTEVDIQLEGMEEIPIRTKKTRKRKRNPATWKRNIAKKRRQHGEAYVSSRGNYVPGVSMKDPCSATCRKKCNDKLTNDARLKIFKAYYRLNSHERKMDFIHSNTEKIPKKWTTKENSKRQYTILFFLPTDQGKIQVCKTMFINSLGIRKGVVDIAMQNRTEGNISATDQRGKGTKKVTPPEILASVRSHIERFPVMASHYCREKTQRKYLASDLNITIMYRMYKEACSEKKLPCASSSMYRQIFCEEYNLGFYRPRKDQCRTCMTYNIPGSLKTDIIEANHQAHLAAKERAREEKRSDKKLAETSNKNILCCNFDLQQVLMVPNDPSNNALFYKQRLKSFNFTIYNVVSKQGDCYMWSEVEGKRGSCEIASCLYSYFKSLPDNIKHIICYSDRCGGQNLNKYVAAMCLNAVQEIPHLQTIELKFLVVGHSEMECDSMHSAISTELKRVGKANWPADWKTIARSARRRGDKPYLVHDVEHNQILDWKTYADRKLIFRKEDESRKLVSWQKMCWMNFSKSTPFIIKFKEDFDGEFRRLNCNRKTRISSANNNLEPLYQSQLPLTKEKYDDLMSLFKMNPPALPSEYKAFFESLPFRGDQSRKPQNIDDFESDISDIDI